MNEAALNQLSPDQLKQFATELMAQLTHLEKQAQAELADKNQAIENAQKTLQQKELHIEKLTYELAYLRRLKFARSSEQLSALQMSLLDEVSDADIAALESELEQLSPPEQSKIKQQPKRQSLPKDLPRKTIVHEPDNVECSCGCQLQRIGEDVSEKLDYIPGSFQVERHVRGKWICKDCDRLIQAPMPAQIIDKGLPTAGLLAHLLLAKYVDHLPLYRQEKIFERAGVALSRSTLAEWVGICGVHLTPLADALKNELLKQAVVHADETPVPILKPGNKKTQQGYVWAYASTSFSDLKAVYYDFSPGRSGRYARDVLG
ncbi:IS66 family transposase, partial [Hydrogenovibrio sp. SC-1]|uniref:IS66 family transposase n=1 Tax=Hydrogenovibrio sp. SC-1 TaxID=2065820 RepID=UPI000CAE82B6